MPFDLFTGYERDTRCDRQVMSVTELMDEKGAIVNEKVVTHNLTYLCCS